MKILIIRPNLVMKGTVIKNQPTSRYQYNIDSIFSLIQKIDKLSHRDSYSFKSWPVIIYYELAYVAHTIVQLPQSVLERMLPNSLVHLEISKF